MIKHTGKTSKIAAPDLPSPPVTLKTVADYAGVAAGTVSSILNRTPQSAAIPQPTKDRVFAVAQKLHYRPNPFARALRTGMVPAASTRETFAAGSRSLVFDGEEHFRQAMNAIRQAGLRVPGDVSGFSAGGVPTV
ncbi:MAG: LacI family DNA-binding transcriptional regulator [Candidatus Sulfotelmatobacter sp.]